VRNNPDPSPLQNVINNEEWNYRCLSANPNITWEIIKSDVEEHPANSAFWSYDYLSRNPNITWKIVRDNLDNHIISGLWNFGHLSRNTFSGRKRKLACSIIRKYWRAYLLAKKEQAQYRAIYDLVIHELRMKHRDQENKDLVH
jgi:hypothetical protein